MYNATTVRNFIGRNGLPKATDFFNQEQLPENIKKDLEGLIFKNGILDIAALENFVS